PSCPRARCRRGTPCWRARTLPTGSSPRARACRRKTAAGRRRSGSCVGIPGAVGGGERVHRDFLVTHFDDLDLLVAARRAKRDRVAFTCLDVRARHGRDPAYVMALWIALVDPDNSHRSL